MTIQEFVDALVASNVIRRRPKIDKEYVVKYLGSKRKPHIINNLVLVFFSFVEDYTYTMDYIQTIYGFRHDTPLTVFDDFREEPLIDWKEYP